MEKETPETTTFSTHEIYKRINSTPLPFTMKNTKPLKTPLKPDFLNLQGLGRIQKIYPFPNHLPNLYLPTRDSYNETIPTSTGTTVRFEATCETPPWLFLR